MAQKTVKKTVAKTTAKPAAKKPAVKKVAVKKPVAPEMHACACGAECKCGTGCKCGDNCACNAGKSCACGCKFGRFIKKLLLVLIVFALGFAAAKMCCCGKPGMRGPRAHFVNGCLDVASVKCPKMMEMLPMIDADQNGCITRQEFRAAKKMMRRAAPAVVETETVEIAE